MFRPFNEYFTCGHKSPVQRGFFRNSTGNLLPILGFLGELYNFCNFVIIFSLMYVMMICKSSDIFYRFGNDQILPKNVQLKQKSTKTKNYVINNARYTKLKNHFLWFTLERVTVMRISKQNSDLHTISIINHDMQKFFATKRK